MDLNTGSWSFLAANIPLRSKELATLCTVWKKSPCLNSRAWSLKVSKGPTPGGHIQLLPYFRQTSCSQALRNSGTKWIWSVRTMAA